MSPLIDWYFEVCKTKGPEVIVLIQVGGFYEAYSDDQGNGSAKQVSGILKMHLTKKNSKKPLCASKNPYMAGFPLAALQKHLTKLNDEGYEVMIIEQEDDNPKKRFIRGVYNDTVRMEFEDEESRDIERRVHCLMIEKYTVRSGRVPQDKYLVSLAMVEMNTGCVTLDLQDTEEIDRTLDAFVLKYQPTEVVLHVENCDKSAITLLEKTCKITHDQDPFKNHEQIYYFRKAFSIPENEEDAIVYIGLQRHQSLVECLGRLLRWIKGHDVLLMEKLQIPQFSPSDKVMHYNQDALTEFNLMSICEKRRYAVAKQKQKSLFDLLSTRMNTIGCRFFQKMLANPLTDMSVLKERYSLLETTMKRIPDYSDHVPLLRCLPDMEWFFLRWKRMRLTVRLLAQLMLGYKKIMTELVPVWSEFFQGIGTQLEMALGEVETYWDLEKMALVQGEDNLQSFLVQKHTDHSKQLKEFETQLAEFEARVPTGKLVFEKEKKCTIQLTPRSWKLSWDKGQFYEMEKKSSFVKIGHPDLDRLAFRYFAFMDEYTSFYKTQFVEQSQNLLSKYTEIFEETNRRAASLSCYLPLAEFFRSKSYTRPILHEEATRSFVDCKEFRHAIMEIIHPDELFVPYSIDLGKPEGPRGFLIYGINSSGKSTMLKSMGLCVWMAQCGLFVPAASMEFHPFASIYTKIGIQDNLFLGHSTFVAEMNELLYILKRAGRNSLVMCDELTSGTETKSATGIVVASLLQFLEMELCFFFTTHLHTVAKVQEVAGHPALRVGHFKMDTKTDQLLVKNIRMRYDRHLYEGSGDDMYGIEIARSVGLPTSFIQKAFTFRERVKVFVEPSGKQEIQVSRYNKRFILTECISCGSEHDLHTHHITPQNEFKKGRHKQHTKDGLYNLVALCQSCHQALHHLEENKS